jgi:hypothetical protein
MELLILGIIIGFMVASCLGGSGRSGLEGDPIKDPPAPGYRPAPRPVDWAAIPTPDRSCVAPPPRPTPAE